VIGVEIVKNGKIENGLSIAGNNNSEAGFVCLWKKIPTFAD